MIIEPNWLATCALAGLGIFGLVAAWATRVVDHDLWRMAFLFCLVAIGVAASLCPAWCGHQFCGCAAVMALMILIAVCDFQRTSEQPGQIPLD